jgi:hypothetical protein
MGGVGLMAEQFEYVPLENVSVYYMKQGNSASGEIVISYQRRDDVDRIIVAYLNSSQFPLDEDNKYFPKPNDGNKILLSIQNPSIGKVEERYIFVAGLRVQSANKRAMPEPAAFRTQYGMIQNRNDMIYAVLLGEAFIEYRFQKMDKENYDLNLRYKTQTDCSIPGKFLCYSYRYCNVLFQFPLPASESIDKVGKTYPIFIPENAEGLELETVGTKSIHKERIEAHQSIFKKFLCFFKGK